MLPDLLRQKVAKLSNDFSTYWSTVIRSRKEEIVLKYGQPFNPARLIEDFENVYKGRFYGFQEPYSSSKNAGLIGLMSDYFSKYPDELDQGVADAIIEEIKSQKPKFVSAFVHEVELNFLGKDQEKDAYTKTIDYKLFCVQQASIQELNLIFAEIIKGKEIQNISLEATASAPDLTRDSLLWLKEIFNRLNTEVGFENKSIRASLAEKIKPEFEPNQIDPIYYKNGFITLLGIEKIDPKSKWKHHCEAILKWLKISLIANPEIDKFDFTEICSALNKPPVQVKVALRLISSLGYFWSQSSHDKVGVKEIHVSNESCFNQIVGFESVDKLVFKYREWVTSQRSTEPQMNKLSNGVFVVHGRNEAARKSIFDFLRAIDLNPFEWNEIKSHCSNPNPYVGEILDVAFKLSSGVVVLMTPDDVVKLRPELAGSSDSFEASENFQARPNVLFEAGMAMGHKPKQTIIIEIGKMKTMSDILGRHTIRLDNSSEKRMALVSALKKAGLPANIDHKTDWLTVGSFE